MDSISLDKKTKLYFDIREKVIGRVPTKSNYKNKGSDNSLYLGMKNNEIISGVLKKIFSYDSIDDFSNKSYKMNAYGSLVEVETNINNQGQLQIKIGADGTMYSIIKRYERCINKEIDDRNYVLFVDFYNCKIFLKEEDKLWN